MGSKSYDIIISGAGPAGTTCAMALKDSGLKVALFDKYSFPRNKICGDFIASTGIKALVGVNPDLEEKLAGFNPKAVNRSTHLIVGENKPIQLDWMLKSYTIKREDFDNLLLQEVLDQGKVDFFPEEALKDVRKIDEGIEIITAKENTYTAQMIVGADGAHSVVSRKLAGYKVEHNHYGGSVRAYYTGIKNMNPAINEVYVHKDVLPGYFWLFPVSDTAANVGVGMHSKHIKRHKVNIKDVFYQFIETSDYLQKKLNGAKMEGKLEGFGLPFYSKRYPVSGDRFLLCGDAAQMIDPTSGEGIMLAIISGRIAAGHLIKAFSVQHFDTLYNRKYDEHIHGKYWKEMKMKAWLVKMFADKNRLLNSVGYLCANSTFIKRQLQRFL